MKKYILICAIMLCSVAFAQTVQVKSNLDSLIQNLDSSIISGKNLYERCNGYAKLDSFNLPPYDTANADYFRQANADIHKASRETQFLSFLDLQNNINFYPTNDIVDVGMLHTNFYTLNYDDDNPANSGLTYSGGQFHPIAGRDAYLNKDVMVVSTLNNSLRSSTGDIQFRFADNLFLNNSPVVISDLSVDFGNGVQQMVMQNNQIVNYNLTYNYTTTGYKTLAFTINFADGRNLKTYCQIYIQVGYTPVYGARQIVSNHHFAAGVYGNNDIKFQGYTETTASFGQFDYRTFYHTNNGNTSKTLLRPIIIGDGFDPGDKRKIQQTDYFNPKDFVDNSSIEEMMKYKDRSGNTQNLIDVLTDKGYDVIIVNYPTYTNELGKKIDGGADYIERNGRTMVEFMRKINEEVAINSTATPEKIITVGPSMSGQIFRYALAFAEKYVFDHPSKTEYNHNCRLYISDDSPQQGATIPMGVQAFTYLASQSGSAESSDLYYNVLLSIAAKQQLIEIYDKNFPLSLTLNGKTIAQGYGENRGHPFHIQYYTNLFNNGVAGSHGFPMNPQCRKIAVANGSLSGLFLGVDGVVALDTRADLKLAGKPIQEVYHIIINNLPAIGNSPQNIVYFHTFNITRTKFETYSFATNNINTRGNLDILPGGSKTVFDDIKNAANKVEIPIKKLPYIPYFFPNVSFLYNQVLNPNIEHSTSINQKSGCFIAAYSALGIKNPDQNWGARLDNRNLACIGNSETYFDSYYGEAANTEHTTFSAACIDWLFKELDGHPQVPSYPYTVALQGPTTVCNLNQNFAVSFGGISTCRLPSNTTWNISPNLTLVSSNNNGITVKATAPGAAIVEAHLDNGEVYTQSMQIGAPPTDFLLIGMKSSKPKQPTTWTFSAPDITGAGYEWYIGSNFPDITLPSSNFLSLLVPCKVIYDNVRCKIINQCGSSNFSTNSFPIPIGPGFCNPRGGGNGFSTFPIDHPIYAPLKLNVSVATTSSELFGHLFYDKEALENEMIQGVNVYNRGGEKVMEIADLHTKTTQLDFTNLPDGTYSIEVLGRNDFVELHTFYYSHLNQEGYILDDIATGNLVINGDRAADRLYALQQKLFTDLQSNEEAMNSSGILQDFAAHNANESFGYIYQIQTALGIDDLVKANDLIEHWQPQNDIDKNFKYYYQYYINTVSNRDLLEEEMTILHTIALGCPLTDGEIVYAARDLYNYLNPNNEDDFSTSCNSIGLRNNGLAVVNEQPFTTNYVYPNPTKGNVTISNLEYGTKTITVTNVYGKTILRKQTNSRMENLHLNVTAGLYFINIINSKTGKTVTQKLVVN